MVLFLCFGTVYMQKRRCKAEIGLISQPVATRLAHAQALRVLCLGGGWTKIARYFLKYSRGEP